MRRITALLLAFFVTLSSLMPVNADSTRPADYNIVNGHFYTQAAAQPTPAPEHARGYAITNEEGIAFWSEFNRIGGVDRLGYPISRRLIWDGTVVQIMQKGVLQWNPLSRRVDLVDVVEEMAEHSAGAATLKAHNIPDVLNGVGGMSVEARLALLDASPALKRYYLATGNAFFYHGLPSSNVVEIPDGWMIRTERSVLAVWTIDQPWQKAGMGSNALVGEWLRDSGMFPADVFQPLDAPATLPPPPPPAPVVAPPPPPPPAPAAAAPPRPTVQPAPAPAAPAPARPTPTTQPAPAPAPSTAGAGVVSSRTGKATWYGADFHGRVMRNGEIYNMYDPTTTASNIYPLGSWLRVTSLRTGRSVIVRVTDTGAFREPIVVDLSWAAFGQIDDHRAGIIDARIELLSGRPR